MTSTTETSTGYQFLADLPKGTTLYTVLRHVSRSGTSRIIDVVAIAPDEYNPGRTRVYYVRVPEYHLKYDADKGGYKVGGCGMDMGFKIVYDLGSLVHDDGYYFDHRWI